MFRRIGRQGVAMSRHHTVPYQRTFTDHGLQEASMKKERMTVSDEQRERTLIEEQIERAAAEAEASGSKPDDSPPAEEVGLKRDETTEKVVLSFAPTATPSSTSSGGFMRTLA